MKKTVLFGSIIGLVNLFLLWQFIPLDRSSTSSAQTSDLEYQKLLERDKNVPKEKVERAFAEAKKIQDDILAVVKDKMPEFKLQNSYAGHLRNHNPGQLGATYNEMAWQKKKTRLSLNFQLRFNKGDTLTWSHNSLQLISMGELSDVPNIGDEATLIKNVVYNTRNTSVSLHVVKGRAMVSIYLTNHQRKTEKNEKELMEIVRLIEPLIVARPNFDDL
jgi:hypothetical protein